MKIATNQLWMMLQYEDQNHILKEQHIKIK